MPVVLGGILDFFVNPALLGGLALLSAPVIIHLLNKRRFTVVEWAAMDFLLAADSRTRRRLQLEDFLLLLLRILLLAVLVFAVARPLVQGFGSASEGERIVVLDDSFSMEAAGGTGTCFAAARDAASSQVEDAIGRSIPVSVWSGTLPGESVKPLAVPAPAPTPGGVENPATAAAAALLGDVRSRETTDLSLRFAPLLSRLAEEAAAKKEPVLRALVVVSDLRAADWLESDGTRLRADIAVALDDLKQRDALDALRLRLVDVGQPDGENCAITDVRLGTDHPFAKVPVRLIVEIRNFGAKDRKHVTGALEVGSLEGAASAAEAKAGYRVSHHIPLPAIETIAAGKTATAEVEFTFDKAGKYPLVARIDADRLPRDDTRQAVVEVRDGLRVVAVDGDPGEGRFSGESGFLLPALAPRGSIPSGILPRRIAGEVAARDLEGADVLLFLNRQGLSAGEVALVEGFLRQGGGVGFFLGNRVSSGEYAALPFLPAKLGELRTASPRARLRLGAEPHAAFEVFRGVEGASLEQVGFDRYHALAPAAGALVAARYSDADETPAIVDQAVGPGRVALFNLAADRDWSDWPTDPSYPIVLQEWIRYLAPRRLKGATVTAGDAITWEPRAGVKFTVLPPDGIARPAVEQRREGEVGGGPTAVAFTETHRAGFYRIEAERAAAGIEVPAAALETRWLACCRAARDSDLTPAGEERLRAAFVAAGVEVSIGRDTAADAFRKTEEGETWRWFAWAAAFFLLGELCFAFWLGRR
jgi:hypothetical protein